MHKYSLDTMPTGQDGLERAARFLRKLYGELEQPEELALRLDQLNQIGSYAPTAKELEGAARMAWRNANRCIGRIYWKSLKLKDCRDLRQPEAIFEALTDHIRTSTSGGNIRPLISVFSPEVIIWNEQLIGYAGYRQADGTILGDPANLAFTDLCLRLGWRGEGTRFDVLPLVIQVNGEDPVCFDWPADAVLEVPIRHPDYPRLRELELKWYALPAISSMSLDFGGLSYPTAPFSGWYMGTEIGARDLGDAHRYNQLPRVAEIMGLDTSHPRTLWKDQAMVALNQAVLFSFERAGVKILDHHTASDLFETFEEVEDRQGRAVQADWNWIVPPVSGSATGVFHREYTNEVRTPNFFYRDRSPWQGAGHRTEFPRGAGLSCPYHRKSDADSWCREPR